MQHHHAHVDLAELAGSGAGLEPGVPVADRIRIALGRRLAVIPGQRPAQWSRHRRTDGTAHRAAHGTPHAAPDPAADPATDAPPHAAAHAHTHAAVRGL